MSYDNIKFDGNLTKNKACKITYSGYLFQNGSEFVNIVYGFGGLRSDRETLSLNPIIIEGWNYYSFKIKYQNTKIKVSVSKEKVEIEVKGNPVELKIYGKIYEVNDKLVLEHINV